MDNEKLNQAQKLKSKISNLTEEIEMWTNKITQPHNIGCSCGYKGVAEKGDHELYSHWHSQINTNTLNTVRNVIICDLKSQLLVKQKEYDEL